MVRFARDQLFGDSRDNRDNREIYYHSDDTLFRCGLFRLCGLCGLKKKPYQARDPISCQKGSDAFARQNGMRLGARDPISCQKGSDLALTRKMADGTY